jgi:hypothetical protein
MDARQLVDLLETQWRPLQLELNQQWDEFAGAYRDIIRDLPEEPDRDDLDRTTDRLLRLLARYEYGCKLLRDRGVLGERVVSAPSDVMAETEQVQQVCNRLRVLLATREPPSGTQGARQSPAARPPTGKEPLG